MRPRNRGSSFRLGTASIGLFSPKRSVCSLSFTSSFAGDATARAGDYEGRVTFRVVMASIVAATGGMLFGYDLGVTGMLSTVNFASLLALQFQLLQTCCCPYLQCFCFQVLSIHSH